MRTECYFCATKTVEKLINKFSPDKDVAEELVFEFNNLLVEYRNDTVPALSTALFRLAGDKLKTKDLYSKEKEVSNQNLMELYPVWKKMVSNSPSPFYTAAKLAVTGNIIDYGAHMVEDDIVSQIKNMITKEFSIDHSDELFNKIKNAKYILYLADNNGEIVFDKLFLETINHPNVTVAVRGYPVINDVTIADATSVGIDKVAQIVSNGYDAPSTILNKCSDEFMNIYHNADLIISKGQGNFEGLMNEIDNRIFFLLTVKCNVIADLLNVKKGDLVIKNAVL